MKTSKELAEEMVAVQPMPSNIFKDLLDVAKTEGELRAEGYEPVSEHRLLWIKKDSEAENYTE